MIAAAGELPRIVEQSGELRANRIHAFFPGQVHRESGDALEMRAERIGGRSAFAPDCFLRADVPAELTVQ
jgi:hypothetical protein